MLQSCLKRITNLIVKKCFSCWTWNCICLQLEVNIIDGCVSTVYGSWRISSNANDNWTGNLYFNNTFFVSCNISIKFQGTKESKSFEKAGSIATEATMCIRTVASLTKEDKFIERYVEALQFPYG